MFHYDSDYDGYLFFTFAYKKENRLQGIMPGSDEEETMLQALPNIVQNNFQDKT